MATEVTIVIVSDVITFVLSMLITLFVAGIRWGEIKSDVSELKRDVAEIKGMFTVKLRDEYIDRGH